VATATWTHGGSPLFTDITNPPAGVAASGSGSSTPDLATACATWNATADENGDTGTVSVTADGGNPFFYNISIIMQLFDDGSFTPADVLNTLRIAFDYDITNGPMGTATALADLSVSGQLTPDTIGAGVQSGTFDETVLAADLGFATIGDLLTAYAIGGGDGASVLCSFYYTAGTFSAHDRRLAISNLELTADYGVAGAVVTDVTPVHGDKAGGDVVTLTGTGFTGATSALFGATAGSGLVVASDTSATVVSPAHAVGQVTVTVT
jgi:hypothetical protein